MDGAHVVDEVDRTERPGTQAGVLVGALRESDALADEGMALVDHDPVVPQFAVELHRISVVERVEPDLLLGIPLPGCLVPLSIRLERTLVLGELDETGVVVDEAHGFLLEGQLLRVDEEVHIGFHGTRELLLPLCHHGAELGNPERELCNHLQHDPVIPHVTEDFHRIARNCSEAALHEVRPVTWRADPLEAHHDALLEGYGNPHHLHEPFFEVARDGVVGLLDADGCVLVPVLDEALVPVEQANALRTDVVGPVDVVHGAPARITAGAIACSRDVEPTADASEGRLPEDESSLLEGHPAAGEERVVDLVLDGCVHHDPVIPGIADDLHRSQRGGSISRKSLAFAMTNACCSTLHPKMVGVR